MNLNEVIAHIEKVQADAEALRKDVADARGRRMRENKEFAERFAAIGAMGIPGFDPDDPAI